MDNLELAAKVLEKDRSVREITRVRMARVKDFISEKAVLFLTIISAAMFIFIFIFIIQRAWKTFQVNGLNFITKTGFDQQVKDAVSNPTDPSTWTFGVLGLIVGSVLSTLGALIIAIPMGLGSAIVIAELAPSWIKKLLQFVMRMLASVPSVVFGLLGLLIIVPLLRNLFVTPELQLKYIKLFQIDGRSLLAGILVLSIMILPIITALAVDALNAVPKKYKEASLALGLSYWRTIVKVIVPAAKSGILAGVVLGTGRATGEAIAICMVTGGIGYVPNLAHGFSFFLTPVLPLAASIVQKNEAMAVPAVNAALFGGGVVLLVITTLLSLFTRIVEYVVKRRQGLV